MNRRKLTTLLGGARQPQAGAIQPVQVRPK
jgi:hypothetical protein